MPTPKKLTKLNKKLNKKDKLINDLDDSDDMEFDPSNEDIVDDMEIISSSNDDSSLPSSFNNTVNRLERRYKNKSSKLKKKRKSNECTEWLENVKSKIREKHISYDDIMNLHLPDEENIWFVEHLKILHKLDQETEEYYLFKNKIYEKYSDLKNNLQKNKENKDTIDKLSKLGNIQTDILTRILESKHDDYIKSETYRRYMLNCGEKNEEYFKAIEWIDTVLGLPTQIKLPSINKNNVSESILSLQSNLNEKFYGLAHVKERIIGAHCAMLTNPFYKKKFLAFVGPPGVGKTELGKTVASAFNLPFAQISCGGIKDSSTLIGHSSTYIGAKSGIFVNILRQAKYSNPVILIDEIDKIPASHEGQSIISVLLHVLDKTQNNHFQDMYMPEIPIDLSNIFFILAMNDKENIDPNLKSRLCFVNIDGYSIDEKIQIGLDYIFPKVLKNLSFNSNDIIINNHVMKYITENYDENELGVRNLEKNLTTICEKINVLKYLNNVSDEKNNLQSSKRRKINNSKMSLKSTSSLKQQKKVLLSYHIDNLSFPLTLSETIVDSLLFE
jgi:ATP-dependent Lon protease